MADFSGMEGYTGLDTERAFAAIDNFYRKCDAVASDVEVSFVDLFEVLSQKWASPKAVIFSKDMISRCNTLLEDFYTEVEHIASGAAAAGEALANANGVSFPNNNYSVPAGFKASYNLGASSCADNLNGVVGMDTESVRIATDAFEQSTKSIIAKLGDIPKGIAFYDSENQVVNTYGRNIDKFISNFDLLFKEMVAYLRDFIKTESDNILLAKQKATDVMSA